MQKMSQTQARKKDAHEKIQLGGLIVKAGLRYEKRALLLGLLVDGAKRVRADQSERNRLLVLGEEEFNRETE